MIRVTEDYIIEPDELCYIVKQDMHKTTVKKLKDKEEVVPVYSVCGYFSNLENAIKEVRKQIFVNKMRESEYSLKDALAELKRLNSDFKEMLI